MSLINYNKHIEIDIKPLYKEEVDFYIGYLKEEDKNYVKFDIYEKDDSVWAANSLIAELIICKDVIFYLPIPQPCDNKNYIYFEEDIVFIEEEITSIEQVVNFAKDIFRHKYNLLLK